MTKMMAAYIRGRLELDDDQFIPEELTARLCHASVEAAPDLVAGLTLAQRANLARYCYRKSHLHGVGLAIAATCDRASLITAWGEALGRALFEQSHDPSLIAEAGHGRGRPKISLGKLPARPQCCWGDAAEELRERMIGHGAAVRH